MTGIYRLLSLALATIFSVYLFLLFGFYSDCFWYFCYYLFQRAVYFQLSDGIVVSSVLVTHYLVEKIFLGRLLEMSFFINEYWCGTSVIS